MKKVTITINIPENYSDMTKTLENISANAELAEKLRHNEPDTLIEALKKSSEKDMLGIEEVCAFFETYQTAKPNVSNDLKETLKHLEKTLDKLGEALDGRN